MKAHTNDTPTPIAILSIVAGILLTGYISNSLKNNKKK